MSKFIFRPNAIILTLLSSEYKSNTASESCPVYSSTKVQAKAFSLVVCEGKLYLTFEFYSSVIVQTARLTWKIETEFVEHVYSSNSCTPILCSL